MGYINGAPAKEWIICKLNREERSDLFHQETVSPQ